MAVLSETDRQRAYRGLMRYWSSQQETVAGILKPDLRAAVNATDDWIDQNSAAFNTALPIPARTNLTATQKTLLFCAVALMRMSPTFARRVFGEVD